MERDLRTKCSIDNISVSRFVSFDYFQCQLFRTLITVAKRSLSGLRKCLTHLFPSGQCGPAQTGRAWIQFWQGSSYNSTHHTFSQNERLIIVYFDSPQLLPDNCLSHKVMMTMACVTLTLRVCCIVPLLLFSFCHLLVLLVLSHPL